MNPKKHQKYSHVMLHEHTHTHGGVVGNLSDLSQPTESSRPTESNASRQNQKQESAARKASIGGWITTL